MAEQPRQWQQQQPQQQQPQGQEPAPRNDNAPEDNKGSQEKTRDKTADKGKRKKAFTILAAVIAVVAVISFTYWILVARNQVSTDDAYVNAEIAQITPSISGTIQSINVNDTQRVKQGDVLVVIDDTDAKLALAQAAADEVARRTDVEKTKIDFERRKALADSGSVSAEELTTAENAYKSAQAAVDAAAARTNAAQIDVNRATIVAPISGVVAKRMVQLGQRVQIGTPLMSIVPMDKVHVDANFKEVQLRKVKIGQTVELESDLYGGGIKYHGRVVGFSGGTGAAFAVIPAQNATGNWIKVVQRLPVRVELDPRELQAHPLQVGLSMKATIDLTSDSSDAVESEVKDDQSGQGKGN